MKPKWKGVLGIALTLVLLASLTVGLTIIPAGAASSTLKFAKLELPQVEDYGATFNDYTDAIPADEFAAFEGDFWCTPAVDLGPIAQTPDGEILFAAVADGPYASSAWYHVLKSTDWGYSWTPTDYYDDVVDAAGYNDPSDIIDIVTSPEYVDDTTMAVATEDYVYISEDAGKNFTQLANPWTGTINDMDMTIAEDGDLSLMVATTVPEVYVTSGLLAWTPQSIPGAIATNVLACAFLPTFADDGDIGICAITDNITAGLTTMTFSFADISVGGEWGDAIKNATFVNADLNPFDSESACIAFPDDFDAFGIGNNVCFTGVVQTNDLDADSLNYTTPSGSDAYQIICKEGGSSKAIDLDVRGVLTTLAPTATAITSINVCGNAEEATILVGTDTINMGDGPEYFPTYLSEDSGDSWTPSGKCVTGGEQQSEIDFISARTQVLMAPDFCDTGMAYVATRGDGTSAFQRTTDANGSWNQISIIDYGSGTAGYTIVPSTGFNAYGYYPDDTLWAITQVSSDVGAFWGRLDGKHWERLWSYANPGVTDTLDRIDILGDGSAFFITDKANCSIWRSTDMGATFPKKISTKSPLTTVAPVSATTLYTGSTGQIWWSTRSGTGWTKPDNTDIPAGAMIANIGFPEEDVVLVGAVGGVYISSDGGVNVEKVGTDSPFTGPTAATSDLGFGDNGILYAVDPVTPSVDVMRTEVDLGSPHDAEWIKLDNFQASTGATVYDDANFRAGGPALTLPLNGILYVIDASVVNTDYTSATPANAGGLWRSVNPTASTTSPVPPYFERETNGLANGNDTLGLASVAMNPANNMQPTIFARNGAATYYYQQIVLFTDILNVGVTLVTPEADATGVGLLPENMMGDVYPVVTLAWDEMAGATFYQYQVSIDPEFKTRVPLPNDGFTNTLGVVLDGTLLSNNTYYWRVRVANEGSIIGAPLISPWSATYKFKTVIGPSMQRPALQAPGAGEEGVPLSPTFEWSGIEWAEDYEYELALDPSTTAGGYFTEPLVALIGADALVSTAWKCDITLDYSTRYYWHVKALGVDTDTPWSDVGTFTTMEVPPEPTTEAPPITIPPTQEITPAWIWAVVIIGAILVIAVIVLIVTTRRVP
jgi:hypothetical protein